MPTIDVAQLFIAFSVLLFSLTATVNPTLVAATTVMLLLPSPKKLMLGYHGPSFGDADHVILTVMNEVLFVPPASFDPPPRVDSAVVRMVPLATPPAVDAARLGEIVQVAFSQRRKIMRHTLGKWLETHGFTGEFDAQRRAEEVPVAEYVALAQAVPP